MNPVTSILKKGLLASVLVVGMILPASANDLSHFQKRFSILRDQNGKLISEVNETFLKLVNNVSKVTERSIGAIYKGSQ